jgi:hypothetical protein
LKLQSSTNSHAQQFIISSKALVVEPFVCSTGTLLLLLLLLTLLQAPSAPLQPQMQLMRSSNGAAPLREAGAAWAGRAGRVQQHSRRSSSRGCSKQHSQRVAGGVG